jgi:HAD superfamily hydrolase (TIGR01509 family)
MSDGPIQLVCFDLGGVVLRICRSWAEGCAAAGLDVHGEIDESFLAPNGWAELNDAYQRGHIDFDGYAKQLSAIIDGAYTPDEVKRVHGAWIRGEYEGVADLIDRIHAAGLETAVLSNTTADHWEIAPRFAAFRALRNRVGSHQIGLRKPEEAAYRAIEQRTGVRGERILFFDDLEENVDAAGRVGWWAELIDPYAETAAQMERALADLGLLSPASS